MLEHGASPASTGGFTIFGFGPSATGEWDRSLTQALSFGYTYEGVTYDEGCKTNASGEVNNGQGQLVPATWRHWFWVYGDGDSYHEPNFKDWWTC